MYKANPRTKTSTDTTSDRVFRGGAWDDLDAVWVRAAHRGRYAPAYRNLNRGFRCAQRCRQQILKDTP